MYIQPDEQANSNLVIWTCICNVMFYVVNVITVGSRDGGVGSGCNSIGHYCTSLLFLLSMEEGCQEKGYHNHQTNRQVIKEVLLLHVLSIHSFTKEFQIVYMSSQIHGRQYLCAYLHNKCFQPNCGCFMTMIYSDGFKVAGYVTTN